MLIFMAFALLADASRRLCDVKSQILAFVNSSVTHLGMESGTSGLHGFPYVIIKAYGLYEFLSYLTTRLDK